MRRLTAMSILVALSACSSARPPVVPAAPGAPVRLAEADALLLAGCHDCLASAYEAFEALRRVPAAEAAATAGAMRAAALLSLRERELGMKDQGYLAIARTLVAAGGDPAGTSADLFDILEQMPPAIFGVSHPPASDDAVTRGIAFHARRQDHQRFLRGIASADALGAYAFASYMCGQLGDREVPTDDIFTATGPLADSPLLAFRRATCRAVDHAALRRLVDDNPRFMEAWFLLGLGAIGRSDLNGADEAYRRAYAWHPRWPALTQALGNLALTAEDFDGALTFYDETIALEPGAVDARLGRIRALTYLGRHEDAIAETDRLLTARWYLGDARYWRALNEAQLARLDEAWTDVELAAKLLINAEVPKLAGIIAYRRGPLDVSRAKFEEAHQRNADDCETQFYLGIVLADQREWTRTADVLTAACTCFEAAGRRLLEEIAAVRASTDPEDRKQRQIARRERDIAAGRRMIATSVFNTAVAYYSLGKPEEARQFARRVADDEQFGERARDLLARLK